MLRSFLAVLAIGVAGSVLAEQPADWPRRPLGPESRAAGRTAESAPRSANAVGAVSHLLLPTSANVNGQFGAVFKTKASIFNPTTLTYNIRAGLSVSGGEIAHAFIAINAGQTITYDNILADVFGYVGGGAIDLDSGNSSYLFVVNSQICLRGHGERPIHDGCPVRRRPRRHHPVPARVRGGRVRQFQPKDERRLREQFRVRPDDHVSGLRLERILHGLDPHVHARRIRLGAILLRLEPDERRDLTSRPARTPSATASRSTTPRTTERTSWPRPTRRSHRMPSFFIS